MAILTLTLAEEVKARAEAQAVEAGFASVDAYIANLIQGDEVIDGDLESELLRGLESGPAVELTSGLLEEIKRRARKQ